MRRGSPTADYLTTAARDADARRTLAERVALSLALGLADLSSYARAAGLDESSARRVLERTRQRGRRRSRCMEALLAGSGP